MNNLEVRQIKRDGKTLLEMPEDYFWALAGNLQFWTVRMMLTLPSHKFDQLLAAEDDSIHTPEVMSSMLEEENKIMDIARSAALEEMRFPYRNPEK